jgi:hypothetical protein
MRVYAVDNMEDAPMGQWHYATLREARATARERARDGHFAGIWQEDLGRPTAGLLLRCLNHKHFARTTKRLGCYRPIFSDDYQGEGPYQVRWINAAQEEAEMLRLFPVAR